MNAQGLWDWLVQVIRAVRAYAISARTAILAFFTYLRPALFHLCCGLQFCIEVLIDWTKTLPLVVALAGLFKSLDLEPQPATPRNHCSLGSELHPK